MPFSPPFRNEFFEGDLIYGLTNERERYISNLDNFKIVKNRLPKSTSGQEFFKPTMMNYYLIPVEEREMKSFLDSFQNSLRNNRRAPNAWLSEKANKYKGYLNVVGFHEYEEYKESLYSYLEKHDKYHTVLEEGITNDHVTIGRKCKGGISWVTMSDCQLTEDMHIHFILDEINMAKVVNKSEGLNNTRKSITAKELRWVYRNRNNKKVASKIQFWVDKKPVFPPWISNEALWGEYHQRNILNRDISEEFSKLFNIS
ncbi:Type III secretion system effector EspK [Xenorhabdus stockiae]|uniref:Type III secretion system effector EspK n=1 Tax=Xenorhabdus stockiae TaxID=351614 RepID=A0A2D0KLS1_9GAMM|nr:hypothetical protein [Xenorhabdus stockiae]PHM64356.1 Type III secretion system effector EspK [Xenorhabdus stockiae]